MKQLWAKEIKEESAKLASYRDMEPPPSSSLSSKIEVTDTNQDSRARTHSLNARKTNPPPIPSPQNRKGSPTAPATPGSAQAAKAAANLEWDEDELETSIYDEESPLEDEDIISPATYPTPAMAPAAMAASASMSGAPTAPALTGSALAAPMMGGEGTLTPSKPEPDLSSLVATAQGWEAPQSTADVGTADLDMKDNPGRVADGSNRTKAPADPGTAGVSEVLRMANLAAPAAPLEANEFGASVVAPSGRRSNLLYGIIAISIIVAGGIIAVVLASTGGSTDDAEVAEVGAPALVDDVEPGSANAGEPSVAGTTPTIPGPTVTGIANAETGLDLIVDPAGVKVSLDGRSIGKAPLQIRSLRPGEHFIEIEAPAGFFSKSQTVTVNQDKADRVEIALVAMEINGTFDSQPSGAEVVLVADGVSQSIGTAPATYRIDPRKHYEVVFKKSGYASVTRPVEVSGSDAIQVMATLSKSHSGTKPTHSVTPTSTTPGVADIIPASTTAVVATPTHTDTVREPKPIPVPKPKPAVQAEGTGTLLLSAKPPCNIYIDGRDTGKMTPQRGIELSAGKHRITLLNNALGIKESFNVKIAPDKATKAVKDYTGQID